MSVLRMQVSAIPSYARTNEPHLGEEGNHERAGRGRANLTATHIRPAPEHPD